MFDNICSFIPAIINIILSLQGERVSCQIHEYSGNFMNGNCYITYVDYVEQVNKSKPTEIVRVM